MSRKTTALLLAALTITANAWAQVPQPPVAPPQPAAPASPPKPMFSVDAKVGSGAYMPMGATRPAEPTPARTNMDPVTLSIAIMNLTIKPMAQVKVDAVLFKTSTQNNQVREAVKKRETLDFRPTERKLVVLTGELTRPNDNGNRFYSTMPTRTQPERAEPNRELVYGWYVRIIIDGDVVLEKYEPKTLKDSDYIKRAFPKTGR